MSLLDDLREAAGSLDPSLQPSQGEIGPLLGALIHYQDHGDAFVAAAADGPQAVSDLLAGTADGADGDKPPAAPPVAASSSASASAPAAKK